MARGNDHPSLLALPAPTWFRLSLAISLAAALLLFVGSVALSASADGAPRSAYRVVVNATALGLWVLILNLLGTLLAFAAVVVIRRARRKVSNSR